MSVFVIGDLHLSFDENIDKAMDKFGGIWENHWKTLEKNWIDKITDKDTVIIAGDISWALKLKEAMADLQWISNLPGQKVLFKGNHDLWWNGIGKLNKLFDNMAFIQNQCYVTDSAIICGSRGWVCPGSETFSKEEEKIYKRELLRLESSLKCAVEALNLVENSHKELIGILHYPPTNEKKQPSGFTEIFEKYNVKKVFYGHLHNEDAIKNKNPINLNGTSYKLISFDAIDGNPYEIPLN